MMTWLSNCQIVDVRTGAVRPASHIEIESGTIRSVETGAAPAGYEMLDLGGLHVLAGLISCHTHLSVVYPFADTDENEPSAVTALRSIGRAKDALTAGVTTVRCLHEQHRIDLF